MKREIKMRINQLFIGSLLFVGGGCSVQNPAAPSLPCDNGTCAGNIDVAFQTAQNADDYCTTATITNRSATDVTLWAVEFDLDCASQITSISNAKYTRSGSTVH